VLSRPFRSGQDPLCGPFWGGRTNRSARTADPTHSVPSGGSGAMGKRGYPILFPRKGWGKDRLHGIALRDPPSPTLRGAKNGAPAQMKRWISHTNEAPEWQSPSHAPVSRVE